MAREFLLPDLGSGLQEAEILDWHVEVGDTVIQGQVICDVETEKAVIEVPSPADGIVIEIAGPPGTVVGVGRMLARLGDAAELERLSTGGGSTTTAAEEPVAEDAQSLSPGVVSDAAPAVVGIEASSEEACLPVRSPAGSGVTSVPIPRPQRVLATPLARRMARRNGIDLATVVGNGLGGRICRRDLEAAIAAKGAPEPVIKAVDDGEPAPADRPRPGERVRLSRLRRTIAAHMTEQWRTVPHITGHTDADAGRLLGARRALGERFGHKVPIDALLIAASVPALCEFPEMNASVDGEELVLHRHCDIGFAVGSNDGLLVPVVRDVAGRSLRELAEAVSDLSERAASRALAPDEQGGQTFTVSNIGPVGADHVTQILPRGTTAIASFGRARRVPVARGNEVEIAPMMAVSGTFDHRAVDGVPAMNFLRAIVEALEEPALLHG